MGYLHIENLYRPIAQSILLFREVYALEKIHGTSAHVGWHSTDGNPQLTWFAPSSDYTCTPVLHIDITDGESKRARPDNGETYGRFIEAIKRWLRLDELATTGPRR